MQRLYSASLRFFDTFRGSFTFRNLACLKNIEYNPIRTKRFQRGMLKILTQHAYDNVPYYHNIFRKLSLNPHYDDPYVLLQKLPILTKRIVRQQYSQLISSNPSKYKIFQTSGSTGTPLKILRDYTADGLGQASYYEGLSWYGYNIGDPLVQLWGRRPVLTHRQHIEQIRNRLTNFYELDAHSMSDATIEQYLDKIRKIKPSVLYGYVSSIELMCKYMKKHKLRSHVPVVITTAEKLFSAQRELITSTLGVEVYDQYGSTEVTSVAFECPFHNSLHVMPTSIVDIVDNNGEKCSSGESGRILLTDLNNLKMPMIKYEVGDLATNGDLDCCTCGRKLASIKNIEGRTSDIIVGLNGNRVHGEFFSHLFESSGFAEAFGFRQFQVIQKSRELLLIRLNTKFAPTEQALSYLDKMTRKYLGPVQISYEFLSDIPIHSTGKRRYTISELSHNSFPD